MWQGLKQQWDGLRRAPPGERFVRSYDRHRERSAWRRALLLSAGLAIMLAGLVLMPAPGPGIVVFVLGAAVAARQSLTVARCADATERALRRLIRRR